MKYVSRICCFALGNFTYPGSRHQHLVACTIRDILEKDGGKHHAEKIEIFAQDPLYCQGTKKILKELYDIIVVDNPEGFKMLNESTFVITVAPLVPVRQLSVDLLNDVGGPAGMMCMEIRTDGTWINNRTYNVYDAASMRELLTTDDPSPRVNIFKERCLSNGYLINDDEKNGMGFNIVYITAAQNALYLRLKTEGSANT
ncbi:hypothetical protein BDV96DRAFT_589772 [Lophiotrema nucula]|uniref:SRR1-like domain-containing protein n=1 Tax=Lophiotrema nucula TaxID=690887 RepID=A0A6A5YLU8_9PLEO|nr:hypothetical protein BDV96DRAFT_589772 [Lophiotrema nucula]